MIKESIHVIFNHQRDCFALWRARRIHYTTICYKHVGGDGGWILFTIDGQTDALRVTPMLKRTLTAIR